MAKESKMLDEIEKLNENLLSNVENEVQKLDSISISKDYNDKLDSLLSE